MRRFLARLVVWDDNMHRRWGWKANAAELIILPIVVGLLVYYGVTFLRSL